MIFRVKLCRDVTSADAQILFHSINKQGRGRGFIKTGIMIAQKESFLGLYKGLGAVISGRF
jgi:hypothetical protein